MLPLLLTLAVVPFAAALITNCTIPEPARTTPHTHPGRLPSAPGCLTGRAALPAEAPAAGPLCRQPASWPQRCCSSAGSSTQSAAAGCKQPMGSRWGGRSAAKGERPALPGPLGTVLPACWSLFRSSSNIYARTILGPELPGSGQGKAALLSYEIGLPDSVMLSSLQMHRDFLQDITQA